MLLVMLFGYAVIFFMIYAINLKFEFKYFINKLNNLGQCFYNLSDGYTFKVQLK